MTNWPSLGRTVVMSGVEGSSPAVRVPAQEHQSGAIIVGQPILVAIQPAVHLSGDHLDIVDIGVSVEALFGRVTVFPIPNDRPAKPWCGGNQFRLYYEVRRVQSTLAAPVTEGRDVAPASNLYRPVAAEFAAIAFLRVAETKATFVTLLRRSRTPNLSIELQTTAFVHHLAPAHARVGEA